MRGFIVLLALVACPSGDGVKDTGDAPDTQEESEAIDADGDGYTEECDDNNADIYPGAAEFCDGLDNDCNGVVDDDAIDMLTWYADADDDGFGDLDAATEACEAPVGHVSNAEDCDDTDARFNPGAIETDCEDPADYNCDGSVGYADADADGFAACAECDDADAAVNPDATEVCNGVDDDCNGLSDDDDPLLTDGSSWYGDADGDGYGGSQFVVDACDAPSGYVANTDDCDDVDGSVFPGAAEVCDDADNDCDGAIDEGVGFTWYADADGDGYGDASASVDACEWPAGYSANGDDCDDNSAATSPAAYEICDSVDNNCDGSIDEAGALNATTWYADTDADGYGDSADSITACSAPSGYVADDTDCNDGSGAISPGATESCDTIDNDCDGTIDEADSFDATTWYADLDGDGYGNAASSTQACSQPSGHVADSQDCDDTSASTYPGSTELCDFSDNDCDGIIDEDDAADASTWYLDGDGDGYGLSTTTATACTVPGGYTGVSGDCDDGNTAVSPGSTEVCDGNDNNCDGDVDEELLGSASQCPGVTCLVIYQSRTTPPANGDYYIDPTGTSSTQAYCDMTNGGWTYASLGTPFSMAFTGAEQTLLTADASTEYLFTLYGAAGGTGINNNGGSGGWAEGSKTFNAGTTLYVYVGGQGDAAGVADTGSANTRTGGFNGGGRGTRGGSGGGGATDIRTTSGDLSTRIIAAGGGGGCGYNSCEDAGGDGGGLTGDNSHPHSGYPTASGGTQTAGGSLGGSFGQGGDNVQDNDEGGGGGGWYGGGACGTANCPAGGGSSYYDGMDGDQSTTTGGNSGNGYLDYIFR